MPTIPAVWRKYLYGVGVALVPLAVGFGWLDDNRAAAVLGVLYAVFMGGMAMVNVNKPEGNQTQESEH
jgi:hypothetical protein